MYCLTSIVDVSLSEFYSSLFLFVCKQFYCFGYQSFSICLVFHFFLLVCIKRIFLYFFFSTFFPLIAWEFLKNSRVYVVFLFFLFLFLSFHLLSFNDPISSEYFLSPACGQFLLNHCNQQLIFIYFWALFQGMNHYP